MRGIMEENSCRNEWELLIQVHIFLYIVEFVLCVLVLWVDSVVTGLFLFIGSITQQTAQLSSYEVTVPRRISRHRRDQDSADKVNNLTKHKSYLILTVWIGSSACPSHSL